VEELMPYAKGVSAKTHDFDGQGNETTKDYKRLLGIVMKANYHSWVGIEYEGEKLPEREGIKATLALPLQLVTGYKGTGPVRLAFNAGEVHGICNSIESFKANWRNEMDNGEIVMVVQAAIRPHPEFPNLPWAVDLAKTDDAKKLIQTLGRVNGVTNRPYVMPPGTPKERVKILRKAFMDTMKDAEFIADTKRARLDLDPLDGETIDKEIKTLFKLEPGLVKQLKEILK